jgi:DNA-binding XRE family transcriptional regulator
VGYVIRLAKWRRRHARLPSGSSKRRKSFAVTAPSVTAEILSATSRDGQPLPSQSCVIRPGVTPIEVANSLRLIERNVRYSANFMEGSFSSTKTAMQGKVLAGLHGHAGAVNTNFSMPKSQRKQIDRTNLPTSLLPTFIREWRKKKGLSQGELGEAIGVSTATISQIENGKTGYSQAHIEAIARVLQCQVIDLLARHPDDPEGMWTLWERAGTDQRKQMVRMFAAMLSSSGG